MSEPNQFVSEPNQLMSEPNQFESESNQLVSEPNQFVAEPNRLVLLQRPLREAAAVAGEAAQGEDQGAAEDPQPHL